MSWADIGIQTGISMGVNIVAGLFTAYLRIPGITKGSHSFTQVWKSGVPDYLNMGIQCI